jgi:hypothetical protein
MTVRELIEYLQQIVNQEKEVTVWNAEWGVDECIQDVEDMQDHVVIYY